MTLKTEQNTQAMDRKVMAAAKEAIRAGKLNAKPRGVASFFEHGQWWIEDRQTGAQWSVVDSEPGYGAGFDFEQVSRGDDE